MLPKIYRLKKDKDFKRIFQAGKLVSGEAFVIRVVGNDEKVTRFGIICGLKLSKKAVVRNRLRRRFGEAIRKLFKNIRSGYDVVILPKNAADISQEALISDLTSAFAKAGIIRHD